MSRGFRAQGIPALRDRTGEGVAGARVATQRDPHVQSHDTGPATGPRTHRTLGHLHQQHTHPEDHTGGRHCCQLLAELSGQSDTEVGRFLRNVKLY